MQGQLEQALSLAQSINYQWVQSHAIRDIISIVTAEGNLEYAMTLAQSLLQGHDFDSTMGAIAYGFSVARNVDRVIQILPSITNPELRVETLVRVARVVANQGNINQMYCFLDEAIVVTMTIDYGIGAIFRDITDILIQYGDVQAAQPLITKIINFLQAIDEIAWRDEVFAILAKTMAVLSNIKQANELLAQIQSIRYIVEEIPSRNDALAMIADAFTTAGYFHQAQMIINSLSDNKHRAASVTNITRAAITMGNNHTIPLITDTNAIVQSIDDAESQVEVLCSIVEAGLETANLALVYPLLREALSIAQTISGYAQSQALRRIVHATASAGHFDDALRIAQRITDTEQRVIALTLTAVIASQTDITHHVLESLNTEFTIADEKNQAIPLVALITLLVNRGEIDRALSLAQLITDDTHYITAISQIINLLIENEAIDQAVEVATSQKDVSIRDDIFYSIVESFAQFDELEQALNIAHRIEHSDTLTLAAGIIANATIGSANPHAAAILAQVYDLYEMPRKINQNNRYKIIDQDAISMTFIQAFLHFDQIDLATTQAQLISQEKRYDGMTKIAAYYYIKHDYGACIDHIHRLWQKCEALDSTWAMTPMITALLKDYPWLGTAILEEEIWVNEQLKRLG